MNTNIFQMSLSDMGICLLIGAIVCVIYMYLLWETVHLLPRVKRKGLFLFISAILRIFLLIFGMLLLSNEHAGRFILIFCGFVIFRLFILRFTRFGAYRTQEEKQLQQSFNTKKRKR